MNCDNLKDLLLSEAIPFSRKVLVMEDGVMNNLKVEYIIFSEEAKELRGRKAKKVCEGMYYIL